MNEINQLVAEYNQAEIEQKARLIKLFDLLGARKGYRFVRFSGANTWSNAWGSLYRERPDLAYQSFIDPMVDEIVEVVPGEE